MQSCQLVTKWTSWYKNSFGEESGKLSLSSVTWRKELFKKIYIKISALKIKWGLIVETINKCNIDQTILKIAPLKLHTIKSFINREYTQISVGNPNMLENVREFKQLILHCWSVELHVKGK